MVYVYIGTSYVKLRVPVQKIFDFEYQSDMNKRLRVLFAGQ